MQSKKYRDRLACVNWDKEAPMNVSRHGSLHSVDRKIMTKGIACFNPPESTIQDWIDALREGKEVRICNGVGDPQIRLFPVVLKDMKTVAVAAQVMKDSDLRNCLNDKKVKLVRQKDDIKTVAAAKKVSDETNKARRNMVCVTLDKMANCPACGYRFRVAKYLSENKD